MGHRLEQEPERGICPATKQKPEELSLAREFRDTIDKILGESNSRNFDFRGRGFYVIDSSTSFVSLFKDGRAIFGSVEASLLASHKWPSPEWTPVTATISRNAGECRVEVKGYKDCPSVINYGICLVLDGTYPRINNIFPANSLEAAEEERRKQHGKYLPPEPVPTFPRGEVEIPARDARLRSRKDRLTYGKFLVNRIIEAALGKELLS